MRGARPLVLVLALAAALAATVVACFSPSEPACAFACGPAGACPTSYVCGADDLCHRADGQGQCLLNPEDGGEDDGGADAAD
jgi:hypothetical protein